MRPAQRDDPFLFIIGAMKSGTTSLYEQLRRHPQLCTCRQDEIGFFSNDEHYARGLEWYLAHYDADPARHRAMFDRSCVYAKVPACPAAAPRMAECLGDCRFVYLVRDPVDRVESHVNYSIYHGWSKPDADPLGNGFVDPSRYAMQLSRFTEHFPKERVLVLLFDDLKREPQAIFDRVCAFAGLDPIPLPTAAEAKNVTRQRTFADTVDGWRVSQRFAGLLPQGLRKLIRERLFERVGVDKKVVLSFEQRAEIRRRIDDDTTQFVAEWGVEPRTFASVEPS